MLMTPPRATAHADAGPGRAHHDRLAAGFLTYQAGLSLHIPSPLPPPGAAPPAVSCALPGRAESIKTARDFTWAALHRWDMAALSDDAGLVVSELVTNALRHGLRCAGGAYGQEPGHGTVNGPGGLGGRPVRLRLLAEPPYLMCMVADPSREIPMRRDADPEAETGRGLRVIESCCSRWGWHLLDEGGKVVWALLPSGGAALLPVAPAG